MEIDDFAEWGDYSVSVYAQKNPKGRWVAWARFERLSDIKAMKTRIHGMRRRIPTDFPSQEKAVSAAYEYAREWINAGDVDI